MTSLVNLTGREIVVIGEDGREKLVLPRGKQTASVDIRSDLLGEVRDRDVAVDVVKYGYDQVSGLPPAKPGVTYVVSWAVLQAIGRDRTDVVAPDTTPGSVVRGDKGFVQGVKRFRRP